MYNSTSRSVHGYCGIKLINKTKFINRIPFRASNIVNDKVFQQLGGDFSNCLQVWRGGKYTEVYILYVAIGIVRRLAIVKQKVYISS